MIIRKGGKYGCLQKSVICFLRFFSSVMSALSGISVVQAQNTGEQKTNSDISELLTLDENNSEFLKTLMKDGYAELGRYKVEKIKDNVYHWDEGTKETSWWSN